MKRTKVDLEKQTIWVGGHEYCWVLVQDDWGEDRRRWYRMDRTVFVDPAGGRYSQDEVNELGTDDAADLRPRRVRIKAAKTRQLLRKLLKDARKARKKRSVSRNPNIIKEPNEAQGEKKSSEEPRLKAVNGRLKSETSEFELNFRAAPSKKQKDLYNFAVHLGPRLLGYVEVKVEEIIDLGCKLQRLQISDSEVTEDAANVDSD